MWAPQDTHIIGCGNVQEMWWSRGSDGSAILFRKHTVKIERTAPLSRPAPPFFCMAMGSADTGRGHPRHMG